MTEDRLKKLNEVDFERIRRETAYKLRLAELMEFIAANGHCNVPQRHTKNPELVNNNISFI